MKYKIDWAETMTSKAGQEYKKATVVAEDGASTENVAIFKSFHQYSGVMPGATIEGFLKSKEFNGRLSFNMENPPSLPRPASQAGAARTAAIDRAMDKKAEAIAEAQLNKEWSIVQSSTARDATLITTALMEGHKYTPDQVKTAWIEWRKWLIQHWEFSKDENTGPNPFENTPPEGQEGV